MATNNPWVARCCILSALVCTVGLLCVCVTFLVSVTCMNGTFKHAAVSADSPLCSQVGRNVLQQGGSAVDGAIAALLCTSVVYPQSMGLGGGAVVTVRNRTGKVTVFNFRETVPRKFKHNLLDDCPATSNHVTGSQWIGVPGELRGYEVLHKQFGRLPWSKLFEEPIRLAKEGIPVSPFLGKLLQFPSIKGKVESSALCEVFCNENSSTLTTGDVIKFPQLAESMEVIAKQGADAFYGGEIGRHLIQDVKAAGGTLEMEDLRSYRVRVVDAWTVPLGDTMMHVPPPPAGGALLAFILKIMQGFSLTSHSLVGDHKVLFYHRYLEAAKFANGQRGNIRDPFFNSRTSADHLIDDAFVQHIRAMISSNGTHHDSYYDVKPFPDHTGTSHVSILDEDGLAVSATSTINHLFGGTVYSPQTGIILNNELSDFCGRADTLKPGEQPPSSMTPAILESKSGGLLVIGGAGGSMITPAVALSLINHLWLGMSLKEAIAAPILFVDSKNKVNFEQDFDKSVIDGLRALGHQVGEMEYFFNVVNAVEKENGCIVGESDKRKMGMSDGY
ncbi:glutathione hydrolase 5 proenzyme isoform X2 [Dunckerocampus dactyliophorus]|uniref:glutathione hydrolase 5 proenzyme isoform X2 n=1 Tax=Dunckerocampus dactyliophorus TaxID=161453 RepID=UPI002406A4CD|nr:glutathione hydrolase 5 proenzyme isoform X2 [Dunckerocampus dactyliophorus]